MSFYTSLSFYRPTPPPRVTGRAFAGFLAALREAGAFDERPGGDTIKVKFGRSIDQDEKGTSIEKPVWGCPGMYEVRDIKWDIGRHQTLDETLAMLAADDRTIYRAFAFVGVLKPPIMEHLQTPRPDGSGQFNLNLWDTSVSLGPATVCSMDAEAYFKVGWMRVGLSGNGYLYPWTPRDLTDRAAALPALGQLADACRRTFPVDPAYAGPLFGRTRIADLFRAKMYARRRMGDLWPFDRLDVPPDWYWGVEETG